MKKIEENYFVNNITTYTELTEERNQHSRETILNAFFGVLLQLCLLFDGIDV